MRTFKMAEIIIYQCSNRKRYMIQKKIIFPFLLIVCLKSIAQTTSNQPTNLTTPLFQAIPIVISSLALLMSVISLFFNYYIQYKKKPIITAELSDKLKCFSGENKISVNNTITIFNKGAQYGAVYKMKAELFHKQSDTTTTLFWNMFVQDKNIGKTGEQFKAHTAFESWAETIVVQGRTASTKKIQFRSDDNFTLRSGEYEFELLIFTGTKKECSYSVMRKFNVGESDLIIWDDVVKNYDLENKISKKSMSFRFTD
jgi:hypothetical protein